MSTRVSSASAATGASRLTKCRRSDDATLLVVEAHVAAWRGRACWRCGLFCAVVGSTVLSAGMSNMTHDS